MNNYPAEKRVLPVKLFGRYDSPTTLSRAVMAAGDILSLFLVPRRPVPLLPLLPDRTRRLLLLRLDGIGDNVCSWPAIELLRQRLPHAHITLAVGPWSAPLYRECPWIDELIEWDSGLFGMFRGKGAGGLMNDLKVSRQLRHEGFDAGLDLRGDILSIFLLRLINPPVRSASVARGGHRLLTDPIAVEEGHESQRVYHLAQATLNLPLTPVPPVHDWRRPNASARARQKLAAAGWDESRRTVALSPLALWQWKQWPKERFRALAGRLKREMGLQVIWFLEHPGRASEYTSTDPVFCGELDEVAAALSLCTLAVANDSGLMHLAVAAGCRTVQLFGPGDAARFAHMNDNTATLHDTSCRHYPCTRSGTCANPEEGWCLEKIGVDAVYGKCADPVSKRG